LAVWICSHSYAHGFLGTMEHKRIKGWAKRCRGMSAGDIATGLAELREHMHGSLDKPQCWGDKMAKGCRAPVWWLLATFAQGSLGMDEAQGWDCSVSKVLCYLACRNELKGSEDLLTEIEMAITDTAKP